MLILKGLSAAVQWERRKYKKLKIILMFMISYNKKSELGGSEMERLCEQYGRKKVYILSVISVFIIYMIIGTCVQYLSHTFRLDGTTFRLIEQNNQGAIFIDEDANELKAQIEPYKLNNYLFVMHIEYLDKKLTYDSTDFMKGAIITLSDGSIYKENLLSIEYRGIGLSDSPESAKPTEVVLIDHILNIMNNRIYTGYLIIYVCICLMLILVGFMEIIYPEVSWKLKYFMAVEGGEPSEFFVVTTKLGGYMLLAFVLLSPLFYLFIIKS